MTGIYNTAITVCFFFLSAIPFISIIVMPLDECFELMELYLFSFRRETLVQTQNKVSLFFLKNPDEMT